MGFRRWTTKLCHWVFGLYSTQKAVSLADFHDTQACTNCFATPCNLKHVCLHGQLIDHPVDENSKPWLYDVSLSQELAQAPVAAAAVASLAVIYHQLSQFPGLNYTDSVSCHHLETCVATCS